LISWICAAVVFAAVFGLNIGSFLNVVIWRLPRGGSLTVPAWSYCPRCEHRLGGWDLVPVFSFLALRAKCRYCHAPISWRYPAIEALTAALFVAVAWRFSGAQDLAAGLDIAFNCLFVAVLICVFFIDLEFFVIPDGLNVTGFIIGLAHWGLIAALNHQGAFFRASVAGGLEYAAVFFVIGFLSYVVLVGIGGKKGIARSAWNYGKETALDWAYITVYSVGTIIPPLRRWVEPPAPLEGFTAEEIETDEDEGGMGGGDTKLGLALGANLLWPLWLHALVFGIVLGCVQGLTVMVASGRRLGQRTAIPFGPALVIGALLALFFGQQIGHAVWAWYAHRFLNFYGSPYAPG
jgi:leader peptidase (prepilin peptidase)/N-methyltransferase